MSSTLSPTDYLSNPNPNADLMIVPVDGPLLKWFHHNHGIDECIEVPAKGSQAATRVAPFSPKKELAETYLELMKTNLMQSSERAYVCWPLGLVSAEAPQGIETLGKERIIESVAQTPVVKVVAVSNRRGGSDTPTPSIWSGSHAMSHEETEYPEDTASTMPPVPSMTESLEDTVISPKSAIPAHLRHKDGTRTNESTPSQHPAQHHHLHRPKPLKLTQALIDHCHEREAVADEVIKTPNGQEIIVFSPKRVNEKVTDWLSEHQKKQSPVMVVSWPSIASTEVQMPQACLSSVQSDQTAAEASSSSSTAPAVFQLSYDGKMLHPPDRSLRRPVNSTVSANRPQLSKTAQQKASTKETSFIVAADAPLLKWFQENGQEDETITTPDGSILTPFSPKKALAETYLSLLNDKNTSFEEGAKRFVLWPTHQNLTDETLTTRSGEEITVFSPKKPTRHLVNWLSDQTAQGVPLTYDGKTLQAPLAANPANVASHQPLDTVICAVDEPLLLWYQQNGGMDEAVKGGADSEFEVSPFSPKKPVAEMYLGLLNDPKTRFEANGKAFVYWPLQLDALNEGESQQAQDEIVATREGERVIVFSPRNPMGEEEISNWLRDCQVPFSYDGHTLHAPERAHYVYPTPVPASESVMLCPMDAPLLRWYEENGHADETITTADGEQVTPFSPKKSLAEAYLTFAADPEMGVVRATPENGKTYIRWPLMMNPDRDAEHYSLPPALRHRRTSLVEVCQQRQGLIDEVIQTVNGEEIIVFSPKCVTQKVSDWLREHQISAEPSSVDSWPTFSADEVELPSALTPQKSTSGPTPTPGRRQSSLQYDHEQLCPPVRAQPPTSSISKRTSTTADGRSPLAIRHINSHEAA